MASARKGSAEKSGSIPHTRVEDEDMIWETYEAGVKLGQGTFGKVYEAKHKETGVRWAIKTVNKEKAGSSTIKLLEREVSILKRVNHPNIIRLNEVFETSKRMYLVMELCEGGELADVLKEKKFSEAETHTIMKKLASAISYLHKQDTVHRDIKLENILLRPNPDNPENPEDRLDIKVTDFGLSVVKGGVGHDNMMQDFCGTPIYMSPEIIDNKSYSQQCDVWAMGVIMYILICGSPPFKSKDEETLYEMIKKAEIAFSDEVWSTVSDEAKHCILGMMKKDPAHRITASEVLNHPWITGKRLDEHPTNVLDMMKMWKDDIKRETQETSAINGDVPEVTEDNVSNLDNVSSSDSCSVQETEQPSPSQENSETSNASANKVSTDTGRKGSGGTKKTSRTPPNSGVKSGTAGCSKATKTSVTPPPPATTRNTNVASSRGAAVSKAATAQNSKLQNSKAASAAGTAKSKTVSKKSDLK